MPSSTLWDRPLKEECTLPGAVSWFAWFPTPEFSLDFKPEDGFLDAACDTSAFVVEKIESSELREVEAVYSFFLQFNPAVNGSSLPRCPAGVIVEADFFDPADLSHLQTNLAICRALARCGAVALFDMKAWRFWDRDEILAFKPQRNFAVSEHVSVFNMQHPAVGPFCQTRGLCKFARPELYVTGVAQADRNVPEFLNELALRLALGKVYGEGAVVQLPHPAGTLPPVTFEPHEDDSVEPQPTHQLGTNRFGNSSLRIVDFDEETPEARPDARYLLAALRGVDSGGASGPINFEGWGD